MPASPGPPLRAATTRTSAFCASGTNSFVPVSAKPAPFFTAFVASSSAFSFPDSSVIAKVRIFRPAATSGSSSFRCVSLPPCSTASAPWKLAKNGDGVSARPSSSATTISSTRLSPAPPYSSGRSRPSQPSSAILAYTSGL